MRRHPRAADEALRKRSDDPASVAEKRLVIVRPGSGVRDPGFDLRSQPTKVNVQLRGICERSIDRLAVSVVLQRRLFHGATRPRRIGLGRRICWCVVRDMGRRRSSGGFELTLEKTKETGVAGKVSVTGE